MKFDIPWFRIDILRQAKDALSHGWRWRPRFIRPWDRARAVSWGWWHFVATRHPNAAERRQMRQDYKEAVRRMKAWPKEEGWVS